MTKKIKTTQSRNYLYLFNTVMLCIGIVLPVHAQPVSAGDELHSYLNDIGYQYLSRRADVVANINSVTEAEARKLQVHQKILELIGDIPDASGPVVVREFGSYQDDGFSVENIAYESFSGYWVSANVYVPEGEGPFPSLIIAPGHGAGKSSQYSWGANFASAGILVLSIDPLGQGERMQHYDAELGASKIEPSGEHEHANQTSLLVGSHIARYWFADGIRGVDYLSQREDVFADRIGTFGCSGGGTAAAYLAAMDSRIRVAAVASFITSFKELLPGNGPQDAEQTLPLFISSGLDFADWVEQVAPRPLAIVAFEEDFFPIAGAKWTYDEAEQFYSLYDAEDQLEFIHGQGGHCNLGPVTPELLTFLFKHLSMPATELPQFERRVPQNIDSLIVTPEGQLSLSIDSDTAEDIARREALLTMPESVLLHSLGELAQLQVRMRNNIRELAGVSATPEEIPEVLVLGTQKFEDSLDGSIDGYEVQTITLASEAGISLEGAIGLPAQEGPRPVLLWMDATPIAQTIASADFIRLVKEGNIVMVMHPRGVLDEPLRGESQLALGQYMPELLRAIVVGKTLVGMRVDDSIRMLNYLLTRAGVDENAITIYGRGALGMVALHAAAVDIRFSQVVMENTLLSYRTALQAGLHKNLSEVLIPNVLNYYDVVELLQATSPRKISIINPANAMGQNVRLNVARETLAIAIESDENLASPQRIQFIRRNFRDPLPIGIE